jgi:hypothetical protein
MFLAFAQLPTVMAQMSPVLDTQKNKFPQGDHTEFVAGLTSLSKTLGCVFIVRPDTFKLTRVSTPEGNSEITPPPDNVSPDVTKFLNTYDCSATRFGGVYVVHIYTGSRIADRHERMGPVRKKSDCIPFYGQ